MLHIFYLGLLLFIFTIVGLSQNRKKTKAPEILIFAMEEQVRQGKMEDYINGTKKWVEIIKESGLDIRFSVFGNTEKGNMDYNQQIRSIDDIGPKLVAWKRISEILTNTEWGKKRLAAVSWSKFSVWETSPELSYTPSDNKSVGKLNYFVWRILRIRREMERDFIETGIRIKTILENLNVDRAVTVFHDLIGYDDPAYSIIIAGKDPDEFESWQNDLAKKDMFGVLLNQLNTYVEDSSEFRAWFMPEISIMKN